MTPTLSVERLPAVLLEHLLDHAALFPPTELPMGEALRVDAAARAGPYAGLVGVFVCPSSRLSELRDELLGAEKGEDSDSAVPRDWASTAATLPVSVVVDDDQVPRPTDAHVDLRLLELRMPAAAALRALEPAPPGIPAYIEVPLERLDAELDLLAAARADGRPVGVKVRCGGARTPPSAELARMIVAAADRQLPLKATQGLHAAVRTDTEHGFVNLLLACASALTDGDVLAVLEERSADALLAAAPEEELARRVRSDLLVSYGTCSLAEPIEELGRLGVLS